jgi:Na+/melibiose symporter-like transporter
VSAPGLGVEEPSRLPVRSQLALSCLWFGLNFQSAALLAIVVPAQVLLLVTPGAHGSGAQAAFLSALSILGALTALVGQPLVGALSDRSGRRWGRRRPYVALGGSLAIVGMAGLGVPAGLIVFVAGYTVVQVGSTIAQAAYQAMLPDRVPYEQRGTASGFLGLMVILGSVGSLGVAGLLLGGVTLSGDSTAATQFGAGVFYAICGAVLAVTLTVTLLGVHEDAVAAPAAHDPMDWGLRGLSRWLEALRHRNFRWVFIARACVMLGIYLFMTFVEYYMAEVVKVQAFVQATAMVAILALLGAVAGAVCAGMLSDRTGRVPIVFASSLLMAVATGIFVADPVQALLWPIGLLFGLGYGAYYSVDWALAVDALPDRATAGRDMGIWNLASTLPSLAAPFVGGVVIASFSGFGGTATGYRLVFAGAGAALFAGGVLVLRVQERTAHETEDLWPA